jgi:hypothetical protein
MVKSRVIFCYSMNSLRGLCILHLIVECRCVLSLFFFHLFLVSLRFWSVGVVTSLRLYPFWILVQSDWKAYSWSTFWLFWYCRMHMVGAVLGHFGDSTLIFDWWPISVAGQFLRVHPCLSWQCIIPIPIPIVRKWWNQQESCPPRGGTPRWNEN